MSVLVIRPQQQGQALCQQLQQQGWDALLCPMIELAPLPCSEALFSLPSQAQVDIVIAVSQHAVDFSQQQLQRENSRWPSSALYLAIGQKTAQLLSKFCQQQVHFPQPSDSEHLLELTELSEVRGKNVIILRGKGGRETIAQQLVKRGANVIYREVYQRVPLDFDAKLNVALWQEKKISHVIVTSYEQLEYFLAQIPSHHHHWLYSLTLYVPSERIAQLAKSVGFRNTITVGSASNSDLVAALQPRNDRNTQ